MRRRTATALFIPLLLAFTTASRAQSTPACPWFTSGTAAKFLGGEVTAAVHAENNFEGSCTFIRQPGSQTIEVLVSKTNSDPCPKSSPIVKALGNEAVQCRRTNPQNQIMNTIAGRVRDVYFVVTMINVPDATREPSPDTRPADPYSASLLERAAEQVAGNLF